MSEPFNGSDGASLSRGELASPSAATRRERLRQRWNALTKRNRRLIAGGTAVVLIALILFGGLLGYSVYRNDQIHHIAVRNLTKIPKTGVENIVMIGSTSRCALKTQNAAFGICSQGVNGVNSDVVLLLHLDPTHHRAAILSIPRDTFVPNARPNENNRIDSALAYGPSQLVSVIEQDFGIPINHFVVLNFDSFQGVVNALGGISMYFPTPVKDAYSSLNVKRTGCVHLNGFEALAVVRARHMQYKKDGKWLYDGSGDLGRIVRDHEFLRVLAGALAKRSLGNPLTDNSIFGAIAPQLEVDSGFGLHEIVNLVLTYHGVDANKAPELTLPVLVDPSFSYSYKGGNYGSIVFPSEPQDRAAIATFTKEPIPGKALKPKSVTVAVEGGIGSSSATAATAAQLRHIGFNVVSTSEVPSVGPVSETQILYSKGHLAQGERVLTDFRGAVALGQNNVHANADVTVVTGSNFSIGVPHIGQSTSSATNAKSSKSKKATARASAEIPTTNATSMTGTYLAALIESSLVTSTVTPTLTAPTAARTPLPSYDPRACPTAKKKK